jgi:hypothetical protein
MRASLTVGIVCLLALFVFAAAPEGGFDRYFEDATLRVDLYHAGDAADEMFTLDQLYRQGIWAGSLTHLLDDYAVGRYSARVYDSASGALIYSQGFDSYFGEYRTSDPAAKGVKRTYHETVRIPWPKARIRLAIDGRDRQNRYHRLFDTEIDPASVFIHRETPAPGVQVLPVRASGDPHVCLDVAVLTEGYTAAELDKARKDLDRFQKTLLGLEPYTSFRDKINIAGVFVPSAESGCDEPSHGVYRNTAFGATFDSLGSERYLLTEENRALRDAAAAVPYDTVFIMVNQTRYGGGGIYNFYCTFTSDNQWFDYLLLHEFGHAFAGLADEYYTSSTAYNEFYPQGVEPVEPNITALLDPANLKWKALVTPGTEIPTPWEKAAFDAMDTAYQKQRQEINQKIARMKREGAPAAEVQKLVDLSERMSKDSAVKADEFLHGSRFWGQVGAFQGAGYASEGLYRPMVDCIMFSKGRKPYCKVCEAAVRRVLQHYTE